LTDEGFIVSTTDMNDVSPMKRKYGLPSNMASCHTAIVGGYVVEGHVPADVIRRMLKEKPDIVGISVPGMPVGTPGMEMGDRVVSYAVMAFTTDGSSSVYEQR